MKVHLKEKCKCLPDFQAILRQFATSMNTDFKFFCKGNTWNAKTGEY